MNWLSPTLLFVVAWLAVFSQTQFHLVRDLLGCPVGIVPALVIYAALTHGLIVSTSFSVVCALWLDSLSSTRLGLSIPPLFILGFLLHVRQHLLLRDQIYAQFWLGFGAGIGVPLATMGILNIGGREFIAGWGTVWQLLVAGLVNGLTCPLGFRLFDALRSTFEYQPVATTPFRPDREIKYGRR